MERKAHWEKVYSTRLSDEVSWHQLHPSASLKLIHAAGLGIQARVLDVGGGTSRLVDHLLQEGFLSIGVLDLSAKALDETRERLGKDAEKVEWFEEDVTEFRSPHPWDIWHDRAVFHFLTDRNDQIRYRDVMLSVVRPKGQVIIATFGPEGPLKCSGLSVQRYSSKGLQDLLGAELELQDHFLEDHVTPTGAVQQFLFCRFERT